MEFKPLFSTNISHDVGDTPLNNFIDDIGTGLKNAFYDLTGQTEKTSYYQALVERENELIERLEAREDTAYQRQVEDMKTAGLSMYGASGGGAASSAGGSSNVHSGSDSISKIAAMIDMRKAVAEIDNVQANTNKTNAEAAATTAGVERDDKYYELKALETESFIARNDALNGLTKEQTLQTAEETLSIIDKRVRENESHVFDLVAKNVQNQLLYKDLNTYDERHEAEMAVKRSSAYLNQMRAGEALEHSKLYQEELGKIQKEIERISSQIANDEAQRLHLSYENMVLLQDYAYKDLECQVMQYQLDYAKEHGYNFGSSGGILGSITDVGEDVTNRFVLPILKMPFNIMNQGLSLFRKGMPGGF